MAAVGATTLAAGLPSLVRGAEEGAAPFKTVLKKALIRPRLTPEVVKTLKENGYPGVELQDKTVTEAEARAARRLAEDEGLQIHSFMGGWFMFNAHEAAKRKAELEKAKQNIRIAKAYGAPVILIVPGRVNGMPMPKPSDATKFAQDAMAELAPLAAELGVVIGLENVWNNLWVMPDFASAFIRSFRNAWVKAYLDLGNHARYAAAEKWVDALSDQIVKLHIKDFKIDRAAKNEGTFVRIGDGSIDWPRVRRMIEFVGYNGWVSIESSGWTDAEHSEIMDRFFHGSLKGGSGFTA